jgi:hypothetical protein
MFNVVICLDVEVFLQIYSFQVAFIDCLGYCRVPLLKFRGLDIVVVLLLDISSHRFGFAC